MAKANQVDDFEEEGEGIVEEVTADSEGFEIDSDVEMGPRTRSTRAGKYPFDKLDVKQSFHVPATAKIPAPGKTLAGAVTNANTKWSHEDPSGELESRTLAIYEVDANGKRVRAPGGGFVKTGEQVVQRVKRIQDRHFAIQTVGASDPKGPGARVFRTL